jgi:hypothetical protein
MAIKGVYDDNSRYIGYGDKMVMLAMMIIVVILAMVISGYKKRRLKV